jgi:hypothetical protein
VSDVAVAGYKLHAAMGCAKDQLWGDWKKFTARQLLRQVVVTSSAPPEEQITLWLFNNEQVITWPLTVAEVISMDDATLVSMLRGWAEKIVEETRKHTTRQRNMEI